MKVRARIDVACNDPDNGLFAGRANMMNYFLSDGTLIELETDSWEGYAFTELADGIRIHRRVFHVRGSKACVGNWCWNGYWFDRDELKRLLMTLRESGRWRCTHGPSRWFDWFNREGSFAERIVPNAEASL